MSHAPALLIGVLLLIWFAWYEQREMERWTREYYRRKRLEREELEDG